VDEKEKSLPLPKSRKGQKGGKIKKENDCDMLKAGLLRKREVSGLNSGTI